LLPDPTPFRSRGRGVAVLLAGAVFTAWALAPAGGRIGVGQAGRSAACPPQPLPATAWPVRRSRTMRAAETMLASAGRTSLQSRVLRPQSGFTHSRSAGNQRRALSIAATISSTDGTRGE